MAFYYLLCFSLFAVTSAEIFAFRNISLPLEQRVNDLVSRLDLEEIILQLSRGGTSPGNGPAPAIERLGISPWSWNSECLHGFAMSGPATSFPHSIGLAASFKLVFEIAEAISKEARAKYNNNTAHRIYGNHLGINCFSPVVNVMRHPLWGRNQETYGEDPYIIGEMAKMFVMGLQGTHDRYLRSSATCKHFAAHNGPENIPISKFVFDARVSERDLHLTFFPGFRECVVEGKAASVMCSYNKLNGIPACANDELLNKILRKQWNFNGFIIADQDALENIVRTQKWKDSYEEAAAAALLAGVNLGLNSNNPNGVFNHLEKALELRLIDINEIISAVKPLFHTRMRLGEFDPSELNPYSNYPMSLIQSREHRELSLKAAMQSFVLLKNKNNFLPLKESKLNEIAVVGPLAHNVRDIFGNYAADADLNYVRTPLQSFQTLAKYVHFTSGCDDGPLCLHYDQTAVKNLFQDFEHQLIIICLGSGVTIENEAKDRDDLSLPGMQDQLLKDVISLKHKTPVILILFNGGPLVSDLFESVDVILECFYPGQETGAALKNILLNKGPYSNPSGRLPFTWLNSLDDIPQITQYAMENFTYRYWNKKPVRFPFGYGLSYTTFRYSNLHVQNTRIVVGSDVSLSVIISNVGTKDGEEVVQAYISWRSSPEPMPKIQMVGFERIFIKAGESHKWSSKIKSNQMAVYLDTKGFQMIPGYIDVYVGGQQPNQSVEVVGSNVLNTTLLVLNNIASRHDDL